MLPVIPAVKEPRPIDLQFPPAIQRLLARHGEHVSNNLLGFLEQARRPCVAITSARVASAPLSQGMFGRLLRRPTHAPVLGALESKFGGIPYREPSDSHPWDDWTFVCQVNLAQVPEVPGAPQRGLFAVDMGPATVDGGWRVRWYPTPSDARLGEAAVPPPSLGRWETRMQFALQWSLPGGDAWCAPLPAGDAELAELWSEWEPAGSVDDEDEHRLFGHHSAGLDHHYGIDPDEGVSTDIRDYEQLFRMTFDNAADFGIGTNWLHVMIPRGDYTEGDLRRAIVVGTNY